MGLFSQVFVFSVILATAVCNKTKVVDTKQGKVEGSLAASGDFYEYLAIRYASVPAKFRGPTEPPSYPGVYKADNRAVLCPQFPTNDPLAAPSDNEDCLILNIFTPLNSSTTLPVMVYLHGGDFGVGSSSPIFYGPQYLLSHNIVLVTVNYRLNAYGFLNLGMKEAPGNAGLKDIRAALRWIQDNIKNFGGDPDNVTVFGQGSGGTAALYLTLTESTKGLFHKIISQSGSLFTPQSFDANGLSTASQVAKTLGVISSDPKELLKLYTETDVTKVEEAISKQMNPKSVFLPTVEELFEGEEPFLIDTPYTILALGKKHGSFNPVPAVFGINTVEGLTCTMDYPTITSQIDRIKNEDYSALDQKNFVVPNSEREEFRAMLKETYFTNTTSNENLIGGLINMNSDFSFVGPMNLLTEMYANSSNLPVYEYIFNFIGNRNLGRLLTNTSLPATANRDELFYIFELERLPLPMDEDDARIITFMTMMWTNFAKHGSPTPDTEYGSWLPYPHRLAVALEPQYVAPLTPDRAMFWRAFYYKYGSDIPKQ